VLGVDDAHHAAASPAALRTLERLARERPPGVGLVIASRGPLRLPLSTLRVGGAVEELTGADLALSVDELAALVSRLAPGVTVTDDVLQRLHELTRGWLAASVLVAADLRGRAPERVLDGVTRAGGAVADYLAEQVLDRLDPAAVDLLECAAALAPFDRALLEEVGRAHPDATLAAAAAQHLIVAEPGGAFRFSGLIGDLIRDRLRRRPERWNEVHRRAADAHVARGDLERALHHRLEAGETDAAAELLVTVGYAALTTNRVRAVARYLDRLPAATIEASVPLRFCRATVRMMRFETAAGLTDFRAVAGADELPALAAAARARLAYFATWQGRFEEAARLARLTLELAPPLPDGVAVYAHSFLEIALRHLGRDAEADAVVAALDAAPVPFPASGIPPFGHGLTAQLHGDYERELSIARRWIERIERARSTIGLASFHMLAAWAESKLGRLAAALERAERGIELCDATEQTWWACNFRLIRLETLAALGRRDEVRSEAADLLATCRAHGMSWNEAGVLLASAPFADDPALTLAEAWEAAQRTEHPALRAQVRIEQARRALGAGDVAGARRLAEAATDELGPVRAAEQRHALGLLDARLALAEGEHAMALALMRRHLTPGPALRAERLALVPLLVELAGDPGDELRGRARAEIVASGPAALPAPGRRRRRDGAPARRGDPRRGRRAARRHEPGRALGRAPDAHRRQSGGGALPLGAGVRRAPPAAARGPRPGATRGVDGRPVAGRPGQRRPQPPHPPELPPARARAARPAARAVALRRPRRRRLSP
jgi:tetratricopeptide (TPR) repeat protein